MLKKLRPKSILLDDKKHQREYQEINKNHELLVKKQEKICEEAEIAIQAMNLKKVSMRSGLKILHELLQQAR